MFIADKEGVDLIHMTQPMNLEAGEPEICSDVFYDSSLGLASFVPESWANKLCQTLDLSTSVVCRTNVRANLYSGKIVDIDIGNQALSVGFCRQMFILKMLAVAWHFYMKRQPLARNS